MAEEDVAPPRPPQFDLEKNDAEQKILASKFHLPTSSKTVVRANAIIKECSAMPIGDLSAMQKRRLAEAYAQIGRFAEAYEVSGTEKHRILAEATDEPCDCPEFRTMNLVNGKPVEVTYSNLFQRSRTFKNGKPAGVWACNSCSNVFIKNDDE